MAQIGCYVLADKCVLTPINRIFNKNWCFRQNLEGKSIFFVELEETKQVTRYETSKSLIIMDELGRGTSNFDGFSIAKSVLDYLVSSIKCIGLFTTHYHMLCKLNLAFAHQENDTLLNYDESDEIENFHMVYRVDPVTSDVTFLYELKKGP